MGIYFDYFRAADDDAARATRTLTGGPLATAGAQLGQFDGVGTKAIFPDPHLEQLAALAADRPYERGPQTSERLWPSPDTPPPVEETSPWLTDPAVERLATRLRDVLADIDPDSVVDLGRRWAAELVDIPVDVATEVIVGLSALARRAREDGQELFCWSTL